MKNPRPYYIVPPGAILKAELNARNIKQTDFAKTIGVDTAMLRLIFNGKRSITTEFALKLEQALDIPASNWLNLQRQFELWSKTSEMPGK